jgi:SAM-dependent methyltransferase
MQQTDWFESWFESPYYQVLYQNRDLMEAQRFVDTLLAYLHPLPNAQMLDIACGEGRFAIQLAGHGYNVTGIDLSQPSIAKAKQSENDYLHFFVHDMRLPFHNHDFDYTFNFFTSFGYFSDSHDHEIAAKSFATSLKKGGVLVVDYLNKEYAISQLQPEQSIERGNYIFHIKKRHEKNHFVKDISFIDKDDLLRHYTERVASFTLADFVAMFEKAGLSLTETFGDYQLNPYHPTHSPRMIMIFKK